MVKLRPPTDIRTCRRLVRRGFPQALVGRLLRISQAQVSRTANRVCWRDVR
jgi:hypothetical protein